MTAPRQPADSVKATEKETTTPSASSLYAAPDFLWEQEFVALAQVSEGNCIPGQSQFCQG